MTRLYDICTNISSKRFDKVREELIKEAQDLHIQIIASGTCKRSIRWNNRFAEKYDLYYTAGLHPHSAKEWDQEAKDLVRQVFKDKRCVMAGETGLDYFRNLSTPEQQRSAFRAQLELASESNKPILFHDRDSHEDFLKIVDEYPNARGVVHCCTSSKDIVKEYVKRGLYVGFTGWVTDLKRGKAACEALKSVPLDKILVETDAPYLAPWVNGKHPGRVLNTPTNVLAVAEFIAEQLDQDPEEFFMITTNNTERMLKEG